MNFSRTYSLDILSTSESEFPAFTICPDYIVAYKSKILSQYDSNPNSMRKIQFPKNIDMSAKEFFELVTYSLEEILDSMTFVWLINLKIIQIIFQYQLIQMNGNRGHIYYLEDVSLTKCQQKFVNWR